MCSIYIGQLVRPIVTPIAVRIRSYQRGGAIVRIHSYPAEGPQWTRQ